MTEQQSKKSDDEKQQKYLDIEQRVKEAETGKNTKNAADEKDEAEVAAANQEAKAEEAERKATADASAAPAAAAAADSIDQRRAAAADGTAASEAEGRNEKDERIRALVQERKSIEKDKKDRIREISKEIKKCIRDKKRCKRQEKIQKKSGKVKGTKNITNIKSVKNRIFIPKVKNKEGDIVKTRQGIANVCAQFYEELYEGEDEHVDEDVMTGAEGEDEESEQSIKIKEFTTEEIQSAIDRLKKGKAKDSSGVRAEQLKNCSDETKEEIRTIFNEIAQQEDFTPESWRKIRIQVFYKKRDREDAGNYRPICGLQILYKLFATVLYARLAPGLHRIQPPNQAGFRPNHRCEDHLMVYRVLEQRCREWNIPLYISTIDFTKAFDGIKHSALWKSLRYYGVKPANVKLLQRLYSHQEGTVLTDKESDVFSIKRGTKQGDPLSSLLFNTVLQFDWKMI